MTTHQSNSEKEKRKLIASLKDQTHGKGYSAITKERLQDAQNRETGNNYIIGFNDLNTEWY